jgi:hypothetical protein
MSMLSMGLSLIGGVVQGIGAAQQAKAQAAQAEAQAKQAEAVAEAHDYNAAVAKRNIVVIRQQGAAEIQDELVTEKRTTASVRGMFAANGSSNTGSALDVMMDTIRQLKLGELRTGYKTELAVIQEQDQKRLEIMAAKENRIGAQAYVDQGKADLQAGQISMISGILGGVSGAVNTYTRTA